MLGVGNLLWRRRLLRLQFACPPIEST